jgi:peptidoglycan-associated lipoprotein
MKRHSLIAIVFSVLLAACSSTDDEASSAADAGVGGAAGGAGLGGGSPSTGFDQRPLQPAEAQRALAEVGDRVFFGYDRYDLDSVARATLERQARFLTAQRALTVIIEGHCDERGTREHNLALGERRASAVRDYLTALGISPSRMRTVSYGEERPAAAGTGEDIWAQNRRAVTVIVGAPAGS